MRLTLPRLITGACPRDARTIMDFMLKSKISQSGSRRQVKKNPDKKVASGLDNTVPLLFAGVA